MDSLSGRTVVHRLEQNICSGVRLGSRAAAARTLLSSAGALGVFARASGASGPSGQPGRRARYSGGAGSARAAGAAPAPAAQALPPACPAGARAGDTRRAARAPRAPAARPCSPSATRGAPSLPRPGRARAAAAARPAPARPPTWPPPGCCSQGVARAAAWRRARRWGAPETWARAPYGPWGESYVLAAPSRCPTSRPRQRARRPGAELAHGRPERGCALKRSCRGVGPAHLCTAGCTARGPRACHGPVRAMARGPCRAALTAGRWQAVRTPSVETLPSFKSERMCGKFEKRTAVCEISPSCSARDLEPHSCGDRHSLLLLLVLLLHHACAGQDDADRLCLAVLRLGATPTRASDPGRALLEVVLTGLTVLGPCGVAGGRMQRGAGQAPAQRRGRGPRGRGGWAGRRGRGQRRGCSPGPRRGRAASAQRHAELARRGRRRAGGAPEQLPQQPQ